MTATELCTLVDARTEALARPRASRPWKRLNPPERAAEEKTLRDVTDAERAIMAHLLAAPGPVQVGGMILHLTKDRMHFVELDSRDRLLAYATGNDRRYVPQLHRYPTSRAAS